MLLKMHFLDSHLDVFLEKRREVSDENGERFHRDTSNMEKRYQGKWSSGMMADYCWALKKNVTQAKRSRTASSVTL